MNELQTSLTHYQVKKENGAITVLATEPLPAKAGRFNMLLKQPKVVHAASYRYPITFILSQSYQNCSSLADLDS